ncbi:hypothetical protein FAM09_24765 [Niastella caeni]|uniref:Uncharacterized protein n=1 Tax=Niastella caeni TaxID=2569763 RepID=A0A4S8HKK4_9BACT|nr:hypothetical protein [Niastella caeni]THU34234.1 hypothetical protein FAM09_24765 [Niastella caeni]
MKYFIIICMFLASCSATRKNVSHESLQVEKHSMSAKDSSRMLSVDSSSVNNTIEWITVTNDSTYDVVTEEHIKEEIDSNVIRRETKRIVKQKGQRRTELTSTVIQKDSTGLQVDEYAIVQQIQQEDSSATINNDNSNVKRSSFMPWWIWLIVLVVFGLAWWKRNSIFDLFIK